jgi:hypothetical protein
MAKMAELFETLNSIPEIDFAECAKCGVEIAFANAEQFEKLVNEHEHAYRW